MERMKAEEAKVEEQGNMVDTACDKEGKAGLGMAAPGVSAGISITGGGGRVHKGALCLGSVPGRYLTMSKLTFSPMSTLSLEPLAMKCK